METDLNLSTMKQGEIIMYQPDEKLSPNREMETSIASLILEIRGQQVMLDRDLAMLYGVETKALNQAVKRNIERFPDDFMFQITKEECLRSQIVTLNKGRGQNLKYMPYAFTENGIAMLSGVLKSSAAVEMNIRIMRTFTDMRRLVSHNYQLLQRIELVEHQQIEIAQHQTVSDRKMDEIFALINAKSVTPKEGIFYDGQIFDAYAFASELIKSARQRIVLVDNYIDESVLLMLAKRNEGVTAEIVTRQITGTLALDIDRHNRQYPPITIRESARYHDRFLIVDDTVYHIGASLKDLGKKLFAFSKMELAAHEIGIE